MWNEVHMVVFFSRSWIGAGSRTVLCWRSRTTLPGNALCRVRCPPSDADDSVLTIKKRVDEVNVLFIATDKHGKFVRNLNETDFSILDDHKPPQSIVNFRRETDLPLQLGLLIDTSGSVRTRFDFEQEAASSFLAAGHAPQFR